MTRQQKQQGQRDSDLSPEESVDGSPGRESREQLITPSAPSSAATEDPFSRGSPLAVIRRFSEDIEQLCESFLGTESSEPPSNWGGERSGWPRLEVTQTDDKLVVQAWLAGLQKDDIDVELRDSELCISGKSHSESAGSEQGESGKFVRIVSLPKRVSADSVSAGFEGGVLRIEVELSRDGPSRGRRIEVGWGHRR